MLGTTLPLKFEKNSGLVQLRFVDEVLQPICPRPVSSKLSAQNHNSILKQICRRFTKHMWWRPQNMGKKIENFLYTGFIFADMLIVMEKESKTSS